MLNTAVGFNNPFTTAQDVNMCYMNIKLHAMSEDDKNCLLSFIYHNSTRIMLANILVYLHGLLFLYFSLL